MVSTIVVSRRVFSLGFAILLLPTVGTANAQDSSVPPGLAADDWSGIRKARDAAHSALATDAVAQQAYLKPDDADIGDSFGRWVAASGDTVVVGSPGEKSTGAAYVFVRTGAGWSQEVYVKASNTDPGDDFGTSVAVSAGVIAVGAPSEESNANGVNGNQADNSHPFAGAAYAFDLAPLRLASCTIRNGSDINPIDFVCRTDPILGSDWRATIQVTPSVGAATSATVILFGSGPTSGFVHPVSGEPLIFPPFTSDISLARHRVSLPSDPSLAGTTLYALGIRLEVAPETVVLLNAVDLTLGF